MGTRRGASLFGRAGRFCAVVLIGLTGLGCQVFDNAPSPPRPLTSLPGQGTGVFTTGRPTFGAAFADFLATHPDPVQPLEFPHVIHVGKKIACTEYCHEGVTTGPVAGLPSVRTCMICHNAIATDKPRIQQITAMRKQGLDLAWQRVFDYPPTSHVKFNHAPHIRAGVECATCHGKIAEQTVARRNVNMTMGFCVNCHNEKKAPTDCLTCHY
jgi:cytochrome c7-like protein